MALLVVTLTLISSSLRVNGYSAGAPASICTSMQPGHSYAESTSPLPFETVLNRTQMFSNGTLEVTIQPKEGNSKMFKGFLVMALNEATNTAIGEFHTSIDGSSKLLDCYDTPHSAVTHTNGIYKSKATFLWNPPEGFEGTVKFWTTYVERYDTFWVKRSSETVQIIASEPAPSTVPPPSTPFAEIPNVSLGCGSSKGCLVLPSAGCTSTSTCSTIVSHKKLNDSTLEIEIYFKASLNRYTAIGFSSDKKMGNDAVVECVLYNGRVNAYQSYNTPEKSNVRLNTPTSNFATVSSSYQNGYVYCHVLHPITFQMKTTTFDLSRPSYALTVEGQSADGSSLTRHEDDYVSSSEISFTADVTIIQMGGSRLKQTHGAMMVVAWLISGSIGLLMPRYMKNTWVGKQFYKKDMWFVYHRALMLLTWTLTVIAFVLIFIDVGGWVSESISENPHPLIGCIALALAFIQPFMAYFRPAPNASNRYIFNWAHAIVGYSAHALAVTCIFLAVEMEAAQLPFYTYWVLTAHICVYFGAQIAFTVLARRNAKLMNELKNSGVKKDEPGSSIRRGLLYAYIFVVTGLGFTVVGFIGST